MIDPLSAEAISQNPRRGSEGGKWSKAAAGGGAGGRWRSPVAAQQRCVKVVKITSSRTTAEAGVESPSRTRHPGQGMSQQRPKARGGAAMCNTQALTNSGIEELNWI